MDQPQKLHQLPEVTLNAESLASRLFNTSGSGTGSTRRGGARKHWSHLSWPQRTHFCFSAVVSAASALPSSLSGCGTAGNTLLHFEQAYLMGRDVLVEKASPGYPSGYFFFFALLNVSQALTPFKKNLRIPRTFRATNMSTASTSFGLGTKECLAFVAISSDTLLGNLSHQRLTASFLAWNGQHKVLLVTPVRIRLDIS